MFNLFSNHLADYKREHEGVEILTKRYGFATYMVNEENKTLCLVEFYIAPKYRKRGYAEKLLQELQALTKAIGLSKFMTAVDMNSEGSRRAIRSLEAVGLRKQDAKVSVEMDLYLQEIS